MSSSMTAFARKELQTRWGTLTWEIRSVNHRYLDMQFRLPENLRDLEPGLRGVVKKRFYRGKLESSLFFRPSSEQSDQLMVNIELLKSINTVLKQAQEQVDNSKAASAIELLKWPGVLQTADTDYDEVRDIALNLYQDALNQLAEMRDQEGGALELLIQQRLGAMDELTSSIRTRLPEIRALQKARLQARIEEAKVELEPGRLEQEVVILLQKSDVDEELDRLQTHAREVQRTLGQSGAIGRRLDFLMQELNREANTLSSKSIHSDITRASVELKVLIEQMREQIQNIE